jgi:hypothetical protein
MFLLLLAVVMLTLDDRLADPIADRSLLTRSGNERNEVVWGNAAPTDPTAAAAGDRMTDSTSGITG